MPGKAATTTKFHSLEWLISTAKRLFVHLGQWLLEIEMGFVWAVAGLSIIVFVFAAIWYIDPALLTLVLRFQQAQCTTIYSAFLIGISNCLWSSCRLGCTREIYKCWQVQVEFSFLTEAKPFSPTWPSLSSFNRGSVHDDYSLNNSAALLPSNVSRLYPNVRGCGYPPQLNCEDFFQSYGVPNKTFMCWVSTMDTSIAMTELNLERAKEEVILSLVPLFIFIVFVLYAFCRLGVFSVCNPLKMCPRSPDTDVKLPSMTPKKLITYKRGLVLKRSFALAAFQKSSKVIEEESNENGDECHQVNEDESSCDVQLDSGEIPPSSSLVRLQGGHFVQTRAEVLPNRQLSPDNLRIRSSQKSLRRKRVSSSSVHFSNDGDQTSDSDTIINNIFSEEIERMDNERLAARYNVLNLYNTSADYHFNAYGTHKQNQHQLPTDLSHVTTLDQSHFSTWSDKALSES